MKLFATVLGLILLSCSLASARDVYVRGHVRKDGSYVQPHIRSAPDSYRSNNYGRGSKGGSYGSAWSRDQDRDGVSNRFDFDDDNDGISDDNE